MSPIAIAQLRRAEPQRALSQLEQLKEFTHVVADTGDFHTLKEFAPQDATTNPSLILKVAQKPDYKALVQEALGAQRGSGLAGRGRVKAVMEQVLVLFGAEILKSVPGRVSTETDAALSFDTAALIEQGRRFIGLYEQRGISRSRVLIKLASTWEGIQAAQRLQREGIHCNMTLLFALEQAVACAQVKAQLISPFVGRILDWYKAKTGKDYAAAEDPGVQSVREIYAYYKHFGIATEVMGASFRTKAEVLELAGCDSLTISPKLLGELQAESGPVQRKLGPETAGQSRPQRLELDEKQFRWGLNENAMATEKLAEGIRLFNADALQLEEYLGRLLG